MKIPTGVLLTAAALIVGASAAGAYYFLTQEDEPPDLGEIRVEPGRVSCEMFAVARGYRYQTVVIQELKDREPGVEPMGDPAEAKGFKLTSSIIGDVQDDEHVKAQVYYPEADQTHNYIWIGETLYESSGDGVWGIADPRSSFRVPFMPEAACHAIAPDLFLDEAEPTPEAVNGILATKYHYEILEADLPDRHPSFGPQSDMARFVNHFTGDVWVAEEGGYIVKMELIGVGEYPNGRELELGYFYELRDVNTKVEVKAPI